MRLMLLLMVCLASGCQLVFSVDAPTCADVEVIHDEDGDGLDDSCDNCLGVANPAQEDGLEVEAGQPADGVGDACDPHPLDAGDRVLRFDSFTQDVAQKWDFTPSWSFDGESLVYDGNTGALVTDKLLQPRPPFAVEFGLTFPVTYEVLNSHLFVVLERDLTDAAGLTCGVSQLLADGVEKAASHASYGDATSSFGLARHLADPVVVGTSLRVLATYDGATVTCAVFGQEGAPVEIPFDLDPDPNPVADEVFLSFEGSLTAHQVDYLVIYAR